MDPAHAALAYALAVLVVIGYGVAACWTAYNQQRKQDTALTPEFFLTARNSASTLTVTWWAEFDLCDIADVHFKGRRMNGTCTSCSYLL